ncbi:hypothetical protein [Syntrophomonas wolfei]|uniref:Alkaline phosphatase n=1 Tax=Syntrophomonas wolfei subsp. wolfei (strain DSM 2245B / Goettingen) TaxID=335541 RepID=Q0AZ54_SYNWW|nr:hypothetical protein [Syntrophomonas wolfei]ABI68000.1 hypothetical protein Swol_0673 [Syntrophomonas wolfei subsp. wolfei str. Goettingen G311]
MRFRVVLLFIFLLVFFYPNANDLALAAEKQEKKAIILVMDYIDVADLCQADTPNLHRLVTKSGTALINIRTKSRLPSSSYLSLASGTRVGSIPNSEFSFNSSEEVGELPNIFIDRNSPPSAGKLYQLFTGLLAPPEGLVNLYIEPLKKYAGKHNPSFTPGQLAALAEDCGLKTAALGNADTINSKDRSIVLLAMNEAGQVYEGDVSANLLEKDKLSLAGVRSQQQILLDKIDDSLQKADIIFVDLGDSSRVEKSRLNCADEVLVQHRKHAIERNDELLGRLLPRLDLQKTMLVILVPNPHKDMVLAGNFGLTAFIMYQPGNEAGLLTSSTTRRSGLVNSSDFLPSILAFFNPESIYQNSSMKVVPATDNSLEKLEGDLGFFVRLRAARSPLHYSFVALAFLSIIGVACLACNIRTKWKSFWLFLFYTGLSMPLVFMFLSYSSYPSVSWNIIMALAASMLLALLLQLIFRSSANALLFLTATVALLTLVDGLRGSPLMLLSPLGSDAIAGGRFYGIGNDYMGILIASSVIALSLLLAKLRLSNKGRALIALPSLLLLSFTIGHPAYGANVGGLITALVTTGVLVIYLLEQRLHFKQLLIIGGMAVLGVLLTAFLDSWLNPNPSHAGKTIKLLISNDPGIFLSIIRTKLGILGSTIYHSAWSVVLLLGIIVLASIWHKKPIMALKEAKPEVLPVSNTLLIAAATVFLVNDTGVIAAALVFLYLLSYLGILLAGEGGDTGGQFSCAPRSTRELSPCVPASPSVPKKIIIGGLILACVFGCAKPVQAAETERKPEPGRVIIYMIDKLSINDLSPKTTPYLWKLQEQGGIGLLNTITGGERTSKNGCCTISAGKLAVGSSNAHLNYEAGEVLEEELAADIFARNTGFVPEKDDILISSINVIEKNNNQRNLGQAGRLGDSIHALGLKTAVIGNSDRPGYPNRPGCLLLMDSRGIVDNGAIGPQMCRPGGFNESLLPLQSDYDKMHEQFSILRDDNDVILMEFGDLSRLESMYSSFSPARYQEERKNILQRIDGSISQIQGELPPGDNCIYIISPSPSRNSYIPSALLTPIIIIKPGFEGTLTSYSTRRTGIVLTSSLQNSILNCLNPERKENIFATAANDSFQQLKRLNHREVFNYVYQPIILSLFIGLILLLLLLACWLSLRSPDNPLRLPILGFILCLPWSMLLIGLFTFTRPLYFFLLLLLLNLLLTIAGFLLARILRLNPLFLIISGTIITIAWDLISKGSLIANSVMSYRVISGARYYGLGNEYMGVLIGATIALATLIFSKSFTSKKRLVLAFIFAAIIFLIAYPLFGINVGGAITASIGLGYSYLAFNQGYIRISWKKIIVLLLLTALLLLLMALIDLKQPLEVQSHLGHSIALIMNGGWVEIINIISRKVQMQLRVISYGGWGWILLAGMLAVGFLLFRPRRRIKAYSERQPLILQGLRGILLSSMVAIIFNDSGITSAASMSLYFAVLFIYSLGLEPAQNEKQA